MRRFSFLDTVMLVNGVEITGWSEGDDVIQIKRRNDTISDKIGAGGEMMVSISADRSGEVTFKLQQTSPSNKFLMTVFNNQEAAGSRFVPSNFRFQDTYRQDLAEGTAGYIKKPAEITRGSGANDQEWTLVVERMDLLLGDVDADAAPTFGLN